jgi:hypothetical protein
MTIQYNFINSSNNNKKRKTEAACLSPASSQPAMFAATRSPSVLHDSRRAEKDLGAHFLRRPKSRTETFAYQAKII